MSHNEHEEGQVAVGVLQLVSQMSERTALPPEECNRAYDALIKAIQTNLKDGNRVHLTGVGQLEVKVARSGKRKTVHFETSRLLRKAIQ